jgi:hypothetical protein
MTVPEPDVIPALVPERFTEERSALVAAAGFTRTVVPRSRPSLLPDAWSTVDVELWSLPVAAS